MPANINTGISKYGWHSYAAWLRCPHRAQLMRSSKAPTESKREWSFGTLFHVAAAYHYSPDHDLSLHDVLENMRREAILDDMCMLDPSILTEAQACFSRYVQLVEEVDANETTLAVERELEMSFGDVPYSARIDRVVEDIDGKIVFEDYKTIGRYYFGLVEQYSMHGQMLGQQILGAHHLGKDFGGVRLSFVLRDGTKVKRVMATRYPIMEADFPETIQFACELQRNGCNIRVPRGYDCERNCHVRHMCKYGE